MTVRETGLLVAVAVGAVPDAVPPVVDDETMTAQTLRWLVVVVSVVLPVSTCVGRMTHAFCAAS